MTLKAALLWGLVASPLLSSTDGFSSLQPRGLQCKLRSKAPLGTSHQIPIVAHRPSGLTPAIPCPAADRFNGHSSTKKRQTTLQNSKSASSEGSPQKSSSSFSLEAVVYMTLLAFQFGLQPGLVRKFTPQTICRSTVVMMQEVLGVPALTLMNL